MGEPVKMFKEIGILYEVNQLVKCNPIFEGIALGDNSSFVRSNKETMIARIDTNLEEQEKDLCLIRLEGYNWNKPSTLLAKKIDYEEEIQS